MKRKAAKLRKVEITTPGLFWNHKHTLELSDYHIRKLRMLAKAGANIRLVKNKKIIFQDCVIDIRVLDKRK